LSFFTFKNLFTIFRVLTFYRESFLYLQKKRMCLSWLDYARKPLPGKAGDKLLELKQWASGIIRCFRLLSLNLESV